MSSDPSNQSVNPPKKDKLTPREQRIKRIRATGDRIRTVTKENIDLQPRLFMTALFAFMIAVVNDETSSLRAGNTINYSNLGGLVVIAALMVFTLVVDNKDGLARLEKGRLEIINDIAALRELKREELESDAQGRAVSILIDDLISKAVSIDEKLQVIKMVPNILSLLPVETINHTIAKGFEGLSDAIGIVMMDATGSVSKQIKEALTEMLPRDLKAKSKPVNSDDLLPKNKDFPSEESVADQLEMALKEDTNPDGN